MVFEIVGVQKKSFKADNGDQISGVTLHVTSHVDYVDGVQVDKFFVSDRKLGSLCLLPGDSVVINFNRYGKVDSVALNA